MGKRDGLAIDRLSLPNKNIIMLKKARHCEEEQQCNLSGDSYQIAAQHSQ